jgi:ribosomal protein S27AE
MKPEDKSPRISEGTHNSSPMRRSDVVEVKWQGAFTWGFFGLLSFLIALFFLNYGEGWFKFGNYQGLDLTAACWPFFVMTPVLLITAVHKAFQGTRVASYTATCPYCGHDTEFIEEPKDDFTCGECHRRVPVQDGKVLDITGIRCGFCGALNFMSDKTQVLICEECDREIPLLDAKTGEMRHAAKGFARADDESQYELVLVGIPKDKAAQDSLISTLQHMLAMTRNQVKEMFDSMPAVLLKGINRRKAEMLRAQIEAADGTADLRPTAGSPPK